MPKVTPDIFETDSPALKVALCQVHTGQWDVDGNLKRTLDALDEAALKGAELAITPECVLHGYADKCDGFKKRLFEAAEPIDGERLAQIRSKAKEHEMAIVIGFAERADDALYNSAALISAKGDIVNVYRKAHLRSFEDVERDGQFKAGDRFFVHDLNHSGRVCKVGMMICFDREVTESVRCLRALGAELIACPLATNTFDIHNPGNHADNEMVTRVRAAENEVFIMVVNHAGRFNGGSFVVGPGGECLLRMGPEPGVEVLDVPVAAVPEMFHSKPLGWMGWGYRRPEVYETYLK